MKAKSELEKFRTRWRRWLGNKTRWDKEDWVTLLQSEWSGWASLVLERNDVGYDGFSPWTAREVVKALFAHAIDLATMDDLARLDGVYATERVEKLMHR